MKNKTPVYIVLFLVAILAGLAIYDISSRSELDSKNSSEDVFAQELNPFRDYLIVVNKHHPYDFNSEYEKELQSDLVSVTSDFTDQKILVERATYAAFCDLKAALEKQGMKIGLAFGYRTKEEQEKLYESYRAGWSYVDDIYRPGNSEYHTGLLISVVIWYQGENDSEPRWYLETDEDQRTIPCFSLLHAELANHGFIDRYTADKEGITEMLVQPYKIRFVGSSKVAKEIKEKHLCLEEYVYMKK